MHIGDIGTIQIDVGYASNARRVDIHKPTESQVDQAARYRNCTEIPQKALGGEFRSHCIRFTGHLLFTSRN